MQECRLPVGSGVSGITLRDGFYSQQGELAVAALRGTLDRRLHLRE
jgi:hypothetical protein